MSTAVPRLEAIWLLAAINRSYTEAPLQEGSPQAPQFPDV